MAYDPYGSSNQSAQSNAPTLGSVAGSLLNPVNVLGGIYTSMPSVWNNEKGIWSPVNFNQKVWKEQLQNVFTKDGLSSNIKTRKLNKAFTVNWKKIPEAIKNTISLNPLGGHRVFEGNLSKISSLKEKISVLNKGVLKTDLNSFKQGVTKAKDYIKETKAQKGAYGGNYARNAAQANYKEAVKNQRSAISKVSAGKRAKLKFQQELKTRTAAKWAIRGAKAGSIVGAAMFVWDVGTAIATPLINSSIQMLGNAINSFENRFMPEMGGKLQMSYLSYGAATERQRAVQAMSKAYINGRSAFGSEGQMYHQ